MEEQYKIPMENFKESGVEPKEGLEFSFGLKGNIVKAVVKKVEKDFVIAAKK